MFWTLLIPIQLFSYKQTLSLQSLMMPVFGATVGKKDCFALQVGGIIRMSHENYE